jgi:hypothetical protein
LNFYPIRGLSRAFAARSDRPYSAATMKLRLLKRLKCTQKFEKLAWQAPGWWPEWMKSSAHKRIPPRPALRNQHSLAFRASLEETRLCSRRNEGARKTVKRRSEQGAPF